MEIEACPWCKSVLDKGLVIDHDSEFGYAIECVDMFCHVQPAQKTYYDTIKEAVRFWNECK